MDNSLPIFRLKVIVYIFICNHLNPLTAVDMTICMSSSKDNLLNEQVEDEFCHVYFSRTMTDINSITGVFY